MNTQNNILVNNTLAQNFRRHDLKKKLLRALTDIQLTETNQNNQA